MAADRMNSLHLGIADTTDWLRDHAAPPFLYIGDTPDIFLTKRVRVFDPHKHHFNPLIGITPERAVAVADIIYAADPGGESTLTVRNGKRALARMLVTTTRLDKLTGNPKDPAQAEALAAVDALLFFPTLKDIFCSGRQFDFDGTVVARIDRAQLGDKQALALALFLMQQHKGQIVVSDGGFYLCPLHTLFIRQSRLAVAVNFLAELPPRLRQAVLQIEHKEGAGCSHEDALVLAQYAGLVPGVIGHTEFVQDRMAS
jgi:hypothetical protein